MRTPNFEPEDLSREIVNNRLALLVRPRVARDIGVDSTLAFARRFGAAVTVEDQWASTPSGHRPAEVKGWFRAAGR